MVSILLNTNARIMIKHIRILSFITLFFIANGISAQLRIVSLDPNFPQSGGIAQQVIPWYSGYFDVVSDSANQVVDYIDVFLRADSNLQDTIQNPISILIFAPVQDSIIQGDTINKLIPSPGYHFDPLYFDDGDNIVVIWPAWRTTPGHSDTLTTHIFFERIIGIDELSQLPVKIYPNPASEYLLLGGLMKLGLNA